VGVDVVSKRRFDVFLHFTGLDEGGTVHEGADGPLGEVVQFLCIADDGKSETFNKNSLEQRTAFNSRIGIGGKYFEVIDLRK
jgi:hypothetical protein